MTSQEEEEEEGPFQSLDLTLEEEPLTVSQATVA